MSDRSGSIQFRARSPPPRSRIVTTADNTASRRERCLDPALPAVFWLRIGVAGGLGVSPFGADCLRVDFGDWLLTRRRCGPATPLTARAQLRTAPPRRRDLPARRLPAPASLSRLPLRSR